MERERKSEREKREREWMRRMELIGSTVNDRDMRQRGNKRQNERGRKARGKRGARNKESKTYRFFQIQNLHRVLLLVDLE